MKLDFSYLEINVTTSQGIIDASESQFDLEPMYLIGKSRSSDDSMVDTIPYFVNEVAQSLESMENLGEDAIYRICHTVDNSKEIPTFKEFVGIPVSKGVKASDGFELFKLQACCVLKFTHKGPLYSEENTPVINTYELIYKYRLPAMQVLLSDQYYIERYGEDFLGVTNPDSVVTIMMTI